MKEAPRSRETAGDNPSVIPHRRCSSVLARNTAGAWRPGASHRSVGRPPHTPRGVRTGDRHSRPGTVPPVPGRLVCLLLWISLSCLTLSAWQVVAHGPLWGVDRAIDLRVLRMAAGHPGLRPYAQAAADLGDVAVALPGLGAVLLWAACRSGAWGRSASLAGMMAVTGILVTGLKDLVRRPSPGSAVLGAHSGYFPSGHAATVAMASGLALLAAWPLLRRALVRRLLVALAVAVDLVAGAGLVWRGYHWPSDVLASWFLCCALLCSVRVVNVRWPGGC